MTLGQLLEELTTIRRLEHNADALPVVLVGFEDDVEICGIHVADGAVRCVPKLRMLVGGRPLG